MREMCLTKLISTHISQWLFKHQNLVHLLLSIVRLGTENNSKVNLILFVGSHELVVQSFAEVLFAEAERRLIELLVGDEISYILNNTDVFSSSHRHHTLRRVLKVWRYANIKQKVRYESHRFHFNSRILPTPWWLIPFAARYHWPVPQLAQ